MKARNLVVLMFSLGAAAQAFADGGTIYFIGAIVEPTCRLEQQSANPRALSTQCSNGIKNYVRTSDVDSIARSLEQHGEVRLSTEPVSNPLKPRTLSGYIVTASYR